jgi:hypothetical protein
MPRAALARGVFDVGLAVDARGILGRWRHAARGSLSRTAHFREGQIVISFETEFVEQAQDFAFVFVSGPGTGKTHWAEVLG